MAGGALLGNEVGRIMGYKKSERVAQDIWNEGDRRMEEFMKADSKTRKKLKKEYKPIGPFWRKEK